jgi:hypothetical protein
MIINFILTKIQEQRDQGIKDIDVNLILKQLKEELDVEIDKEELVKIVKKDEELRMKHGFSSDEEPEEKPKKGRLERKPKVTETEDSYIISAYELVNGEYEEYTYKITKDKLRKIKLMYCTKPSPTIDKLCRELDITRKDFFLVKTAFSITKTSLPVLDEDLDNKDHEELIEMTLEQKQLNFEKKLEESELKYLRRQVEKYLSEEYKVSRLLEQTAEHMRGIDFSKNIIIPKKYNVTESSKILEVPIFDLHLGKLAWSGETHFNNYDHKIAKERFMFVVNEVLRRTEDMEFEKIWFPVGSDFFNFDNRYGTTEKGTSQDNDLRHPKMFKEGYEMYVRAINLLSKKAPVEAFLVQGNHDFMTSYSVCFALEQGFSKNPRVNIDPTPTTRKYKSYGVNLIGYSHGDKERNRISYNMQDEVPELWGKSKYREWHLGHLHSESLKNYGSLKVRRLSSLTDPDSFHSVYGYVGAIAETQIFIWDKENALDSMFPVVVRM